MQYNTVIFVYPYIITLRDYHRFGLDYLESKGYNVIALTVWAKNAIKDFNYSAGIYEGNNYERIELKQFKKYIEQQGRVIYYFSSYNAAYISVFDIIAKFGGCYIISGKHGLIHFHPTGISLNIIKAKLGRDIIKRTYRFIEVKLKQKITDNRIKNIKSKPLLITATNSESPGVPDCLIDNNLACVHAMDYDRYIENERENVIPSEEYIVFIEGGFIELDHDGVMAGCQNVLIDVTRFENQLKHVFDVLEGYYKVPVVIAGHPHSHYTSDEFCGRKILLGQTEKLIPHAKLVIMQMSTSINHALIYDKELLILYNDDFKHMNGFEDFYADWLRPTCDFLGLKECDMDVPEMFNEPYKYISKPSNEARKDYINKYIKQESTPEKLIIEVIEEKIKMLV